MITKYDNFLNEGIETTKYIVIEVNNMDDVLYVKSQIEKIQNINFDYNQGINNIRIFPNWLFIELNPNRNNYIYINYWSNEGNTEEHKLKIESIVNNTTEYYNHIYTMKEIQIIMNKIRGFFRLVPDYSPRKIIRKNHDN